MRLDEFRMGMLAIAACLLGSAGLILPCATVAAAAENTVSGGPRQLLITYRAEPAHRPEFRRYLQSTLAAQLQKLEREGVLKSFQILFNPFVQPRTWDAMTVLSFNRFVDTKRWQEIERTSPGGLTAAGLKLGAPVGTYSADLTWDGAAANGGPARDRVFYIIPYTYVAADQYKKYVDGYVLPQVRGWLEDGVLSRYAIYMNRYPVGEPEPWDVLFIYEYRDLESFGRRDEVSASVRGPLRADAEWKRWSDIKSTVRTESENTIAELLAGE
jgi:DNA-binding Lrp family transcriptional regulator